MKPIEADGGLASHTGRRYGGALAWIGLVVVLWLGPVLLRRGGYEVAATWWLCEGLAYESAGALALLVAAWFYFACWAERATSPHDVRAGRGMWLLLAIVHFVMFGEEVGWGKELFGFGRFAAMAQINTQGELTLHNLRVFQPSLSVNYLQLVWSLGVLVYLGVVPFWDRPAGWITRFRIPRPSPSIGLACWASFGLFLLPAAWSTAYLTDREQFEIHETTIELLLCAVAWQAWREARLSTRVLPRGRGSVALALVVLVVACAMAVVMMTTRSVDAVARVQQYHLTSGLQALEVGNLDAASRRLEEALLLNPQEQQAHYLLGVVRHEQQSTPAAVEHLEAAVRLDPDDLGARSFLGMAYAANDQLDRALEQFDYVLQRDPERPQARENVRSVRNAIRQRKLSEAIERRERERAAAEEQGTEP